jgi:hypothetical protein
LVSSKNKEGKAMKICFENAEKLYTGIDCLKDDLGIEPVSENADITVLVTELSEEKI